MRLSLNQLCLSAMVGLVGMAVPGFAKVSVSSSGKKTTYDVMVEGVNFKKVNIGGKDFEQATLSGVEQFSGIEFQEGMPEIPVVRFLVTGDASVKVIDNDQKNLEKGQIKHYLKPNQPSWSKSLKVQPPVTFDVNAYQSKSFVGAESFSIEDAGSVRGVSQKLVTLRPFAYQASSNQFVLHKHFVISVENSQSKELSDVTPTIAFVVGAKFANNQKLYDLEQEKTNQGLRVERLVIGQNVANTDVAIRAALQKLLKDPSKNLKFALIVGDVEDVTSHTSNIITGVTDHFYRAIDTNAYETDINGPDIGVGRLSVKTDDQLNVVVNKLLRYGQGEFGRVDWMNHPSFVTTHDRWQVAEGTHNDVIAKYFAPLGYDRVFPDAAEKGGDKLYPISLNASKAQIVSHMKAGRTIINFSGHGSNTGWEDVTTPDVNSFDHSDSLPYVIGNACITGDFRKEPVFGETWQREPQGAITYWGSMDSSYWDEDDVLEKALYEGMFVKNIRLFDALHQNALSAVWKFYGGANRSKYYWETYVTFGDPSLEFRVAKPDSIELEGIDAIFVGAPTTVVRVKNLQGQPVAGVNVVLRSNDSGTVLRAVSSASGEAVLATGQMATISTDLTLNAFGSGVVSVEKSVPMLAPNGPYLGFSKWHTNNRQSNNVFVNEKVMIGATVENFGSVASSQSKVVLSEIKGPAKILGANAIVPALEVRRQGGLGQGLQIEVLPTANNGDVVQLILDWSTPEGVTGRTSLSLTVLKGQLSVEALDYGSPEVEGVSGSGEVFITVKNTGGEVIRDAKFTFAPGVCSRSVRSDATIASLNPGETVRIAEAITVEQDHACIDGSVAKIKVQGDYAGTAGRPTVSMEASYLVGLIEIFSNRQQAMALPLPDKGDPVVQTFNVGGSGLLRDISIAVKVLHSYVSDLIVVLQSPSGKRITLRDKEGGSDDDLVQRWGRGGLDVPELATLKSSDVQGTWSLSIKDDAVGDKGTWEDVEIEIRY